MALGDGSQPGSDPVFKVEALSKVPTGYRHYWRTRSYDTYDEGGWSSNMDEREEFLFPDSFEISYPEWERSRIANGKASWDAHRTQHQHLSRGKIITETFF